MDKNCICEKIEELLEESFSIQRADLCQENREKSLLKAPFYLNGIHLVYLLAAVEKNFQIRIKSQELDDYAFTTISNIAGIIERQLKNSGEKSIK